MKQQSLSYEEQIAERPDLPRTFEHRLTTNSGYADDFLPRSVFHNTEQRETLFESLWSEGGSKFWIANYTDVLVDAKANRVAYDFWARKTRPQITDAQTRYTAPAPLEPPHPWGGRRPCLETDYYDQVSKPHVSIIDMGKTPIVAFTAHGLKASDGQVHKGDVVCFATGFDALTGGMQSMDLISTEGILLSEKWAPGVSTYLGLSMAGYLNLFYFFAVHGPTASNARSCIGPQADWIVNAMVRMLEEGIESIEPALEAESWWHKDLCRIYSNGLSDTSLWYDGSNISGKTVEPLVFMGGFPLYRKTCYTVLDDNFQGFKSQYRQEQNTPGVYLLFCILYSDQGHKGRLINQNLSIE